MGVRLHFQGAGMDPFTLELDRFHDRIQNARPAFEEMGRLVAESMRQQFDAEGGHSGPRWQALSPRYAAWKLAKYGPKPILERTGALRSSLVNTPMGVWDITDHGMTVGTDIPYAHYHQNGAAPNLPQREIMGPFNRSEMKEFAKVMQRWIIGQRVRG